jgi:hypothetical protein
MREPRTLWARFRTRAHASFRLLSAENLASRLDQHGAGAFSQIRAANEDDVCRCIDTA